MRLNRCLPVQPAFLVLVAALGVSGAAHARKNGIQTTSCAGCHRVSGTSSLTLTPDRDPILPGDVVVFTATITGNSATKAGGIYVAEPTVGTLGTSDGQGLTLSDGALTHSSPKAAVSGVVTFNFTWTAPSQPGGLELDAYAVAANGNGQNTGDAPTEGSTRFVWGCTAATFYFDADGDGHGVMDAGTTIGCADQPPPPAYAAVADDCDAAHKDVYPGAREKCNGKDDNCDGNIDENTMPEPLYPDPDGDGYYGDRPGDPVVGCLPLAGYADEPGDCAPIEADKHPGAPEVCNLIDDDCDGQIDEGVRPQCGVGRCARESPTCDPSSCQPGTPVAEVCNGLDDDCNGEADDSDEMCPEGEQCLGIHCVPIDAPGATGGVGSGGSGAITGSTGGTSSSVGGAPAKGGAGSLGGAANAAATGGAAMSGPLGAEPGMAGGDSSTPRRDEAGGCSLRAPNPAPPYAVLGLTLLNVLGVARRRGARRRSER
ncbi:MAG TPA: putative metal-binding motif-containing protein [Polyangiaceae bacterium]|jgi:hypothetical protein|nr:putative metal-binding motif-containing protein [Polyangiaceae bacterium]